MPTGIIGGILVICLTSKADTVFSSIRPYSFFIFRLTSSQRKRVKKTLKAQFSGYSNADERLDCYTHYDSDLD